VGQSPMLLAKSKRGSMIDLAYMAPLLKSDARSRNPMMNIRSVVT
jgi:hypothetical protein